MCRVGSNYRYNIHIAHINSYDIQCEPHQCCSSLVARRRQTCSFRSDAVCPVRPHRLLAQFRVAFRHRSLSLCPMHGVRRAHGLHGYGPSFVSFASSKLPPLCSLARSRSPIHQHTHALLPDVCDDDDVVVVVVIAAVAVPCSAQRCAVCCVYVVCFFFSSFHRSSLFLPFLLYHLP